MAVDARKRSILLLCLLMLWEDRARVCSGFDLNPPKITLDCTEKQLTTFPSLKCKLGNQTIIHTLILSKNRFHNVTPSMFSRLNNLETLMLDDNDLMNIQPGAFNQLTSLRSLVLSNNRISHLTSSMFLGLNSLEKLILDNNIIATIQPGSLDNMAALNDLNLEKNNLEDVPVFVNTSSTISALNLDFNPISSLRLSTMRQYPQLMYLYLKKTKIPRLPSKVFYYNTKLFILNLEDTPLQFIDDNAFDGVKLSILNLKGTQISQLPSKGMKFLHKIDIRDVTNLWELPFKSFQSLREANVEYHFHCCLFNQILENAVDPTPQNSTFVRTCPTPSPILATTQLMPTTTPATQRPTDIFNIHKDSYVEGKNYTLTFAPTKCVEAGIKIHSVNKKVRLICKPFPDAFNPCEDLLGSTGLRVCTWCVLVFALVGNGLQLVVLCTSKRNTLMYQLLMCNLSLANLLMGIYLTMLAVADARSCGEYQNHARAWQYGPGCNIAGFLSILSTELAVYILTLITIERYFTIVHPLKLHMHLSTKQVMVLVLLGWVFGVTMAILPIFSVSSYQKVAICLPFDVQTVASKAYVSLLLITNGLAFLVVLFCYARMYCSLGGTTRSSATRIESRVAKKMALLVLSNFACWFPVALFSFIAIYGSPVIDVPTSKFLLVFIYPINAFTNPYLYALGTKHFQLDLMDLLKNFGVCPNSIEKLRSRLLDQVSTLPNSSRVYMGSRSSVNSYRVPPHSLNSSPKPSDSPNDSSAHSFSLRFLSIPKINLPSCRHKLKSPMERSASSECPASHVQPLLKVNIHGSADSDSHLEECCRLSAKEVIIIGGNVMTDNTKFQHRALTNNHLSDSRSNSVDGDGIIEENDSMPSQNIVPVVMVTSC